MERPPNFENREAAVDQLIHKLAESEDMNFDDIMSDIITFAAYELNDSSNPEYIDRVAEKIGISSEEMSDYAIKKAKEYLNG